MSKALEMCRKTTQPDNLFDLAVLRTTLINEALICILRILGAKFLW